MTMSVSPSKFGRATGDSCLITNENQETHGSPSILYPDLVIRNKDEAPGPQELELAEES